jgi:hypothetical protein
MAPKLLVAIICSIISAICIFIAVERYQSNSDNVQAMNQMSGPMLRNMTGGQALEPATPAATKYAAFFALLAAGVAVTAFIMHTKDQNQQSPARRA